MTGTIAHLEERLAALRGRREEAVTAVDADKEALAARRTQIVAEVPDELLPIYERQRSAGKVGAGCSAPAGAALAGWNSIAGHSPASPRRPTMR